MNSCVGREHLWTAKNDLFLSPVFSGNLTNKTIYGITVNFPSNSFNPGLYLSSCNHVWRIWGPTLWSHSNFSQNFKANNIKSHQNLASEMAQQVKGLSLSPKIYMVEEGNWLASTHVWQCAPSFPSPHNKYNATCFLIAQLPHIYIVIKTMTPFRRTYPHSWVAWLVLWTLLCYPSTHFNLY